MAFCDVSTDTPHFDEIYAQADLVLLMASLLLTHIFGQFCTDGSVCTAIFTPVCIMQACPDLLMLMLIDVSIKEFICSVEVRGTLSSSVGDYHQWSWYNHVLDVAVAVVL